jgi:hypothetical protein
MHAATAHNSKFDAELNGVVQLFAGSKLDNVFPFDFNEFAGLGITALAGFTIDFFECSEADQRQFAVSFLECFGYAADK